MLRRITFYLVALLSIFPLLGQTEGPSGPETVLSLSVLKDIIHEVSGDLAFQNEVLLGGVYRNRLPKEYESTYFETDFILKKLKEYGLENAEILDLPTRSEKTWDAEMAELWTTKPELRKIADLMEVPASLCSGSVTTDTTAELVYVGPGDRESFYQGKDVKGKIVLVNGAPDMARRLAVDKFGALGLIGYESSHPEHDPDQVGWSSLRVTGQEKPTFAFMVSTRQGQLLRDSLERGETIEVRAVCKTQQVPYKEQMVAAFIPGRDFPEEELVFTAHLFEGLTMRGANDNDSGCVAVLETARSLQKLVADGKIPPLRRTVRFLFVPEISGTAAYVRGYPQIAARFFANINEDMVGEALALNKSFFTLERTPDSLPSYLNDVLESIIQWVVATQYVEYGSEDYRPEIVSPNGTRDPFPFMAIGFKGGSDHMVFNDGGVRVPAVTFNCWPDMWYHTSRDTPDKSDPTQLKRAVFIGVAAAAFLANAGPLEIQKMATETSGRAAGRLGLEKLRAENMIVEAAPAGVHTALKEALNIVNQGFEREKEALASIRFFSKGDSDLEAMLTARSQSLEGLRPQFLRDVEETFSYRCRQEKLTPQNPALSDAEVRLSRLVPVRTEKMRGYFNGWEFYQKVREMKIPPTYRIGGADFEVRNFIDGRRSILDIRNAVSAEYGPVGLEGVENYILLLEKTGFVKIEQKAQQADKEPEVVSLLGRKFYAAPAEGEELAKLQAVLEKAARDIEANPASVEAIIAYGRALGGLWRFHEAIDVYTRGIASHPDEAMLYRHRGHRYISIREFQKAASDLAKAAALNDKDFDIWYHLGLAHYLQGEFDKARAAYESCLKVAADDDSKIAVSNWLYATLRRLDRKEDAARVLAGISETMKVKENTSYLDLLLFFKGLKTEEEILNSAVSSELDAATAGYGVGCRHLYSGQKEKARGLFEKIVAGRYWPAFGFIAAEAELARMK